MPPERESRPRREAAIPNDEASRTTGIVLDAPVVHTTAAEIVAALSPELERGSAKFEARCAYVEALAPEARAGHERRALRILKNRRRVEAHEEVAAPVVADLERRQRAVLAKALLERRRARANGHAPARPRTSRARRARKAAGSSRDDGSGPGEPPRRGELRPVSFAANGLANQLRPEVQR